MEFNIELPINSTSLGQMSFGILFELFSRRDSLLPNIFPIGEGVDFTSFDIPNQEEFAAWFRERTNSSITRVGKKLPLIRYWHIQNSEKVLPNSKSVLWTVHELDSITETERDICNFYDQVCVTSNYSKEVFNKGGVNAEMVPNFFDALHFFKKDVQKQEGVIQFALIGKTEKRKHTHEAISTWASKFGGNGKYRLNTLIYNRFLPPDVNQRSIDNIFRGSPPFNFNRIEFQQKNFSVNDLINFCDIILDASGGEGWSLPTFNGMALGKQVVCMNAHGTATYANKDNAVLFEPNGKTEAWDGTFFIKGMPFNQGNIYTFTPQALSDAIDVAVDRVEKNIENTNGLSLQQEYSVKRTVDSLLSFL